MIQGPITLLILDGFGDGPRHSFDATFAAAMPHFNGLRPTIPATHLVTSGPPGVTGYTTGRPQVREVFAYWPALVGKAVISPQVELH